MLAVVIVISRGHHHGPVPVWASAALWVILAVTVGLIAWVCVEMWRGRM
jgi:hypothetical protein